MVTRHTPIKKYDGVRASESPLYVIGLEYIADSMLISEVISCYFVRLDCPSSLRRQSFTYTPFAPTSLPTMSLVVQ